MSRSKEFDPSEALDRAIELFHRQGYRGTSMKELVDRMGIGRGSLYETFGDKQQLFEAALRRYGQRLLDRAARLGSVRAYVAEVVARNAGSPGLGCLVANSCVELVPHDPRVEGICSDILSRLERGFVAELRRAAAAGEGAAMPARVGARFAVTSIIGLEVMGRSGATPAMIRDAGEVVMARLP